MKRNTRTTFLLFFTFSARELGSCLGSGRAAKTYIRAVAS
jgi:hypothetical protein